MTQNMEIKVLGIGTDCVSLFTKEGEEFIGYVGVNMFYFDTEILEWYKLYESELLDEFRPRVRNGEIKLNDVKFIKLKTKKLNISDAMCSGYAIRFNEADANGIIINKDVVNIKYFEQMKVAGTIVDYEIDDNGVKIIKKFDLNGR